MAVVLLFTLAFPAFAAKNVSVSPSYGAYKHVFIIGVDGAGKFFRDADTPNFDRIFADGYINYAVRTEVASDSGPNWASILNGVSYYKHWIHNGSSGEVQHTSDFKYPTIFTLVRRAFPDAELASFVNWNNINFGMIETDVGVTEEQVGNDDGVTDAICQYFDDGNKPTLFFVQLDEVDAAGHAHGSDSKEYYDALHEADARVGRIYDAIERNGLLEDGLFIVTADHGHKATGGHGRFSMRESLTTIAAAGRTVVAGGTPDKRTRDRDIAAIALFALGVERPGYMTARMPESLFEETPGERRSFFKDVLDGVISAVMWLYTLTTAKK